SAIAYRRPYYQLPLLNLVRKGFVVFAIDPIGQGERLQYYDPETGESRIGSSTREHSYPAAQVFLTGKSIARYFTWDGIRAIDYLMTRPEVDPDRIGVHGLSGGGTQTAYIMAMDDRVAAAAPAGYITSYRRLMESDGVQDGEQNFYHGIASGLDHGDLLEVRAPKPTLIVATTRDFFSIQGVRETYAEAKQVFQVLGRAGNLLLVEDDHPHGYTRKNREAVYAFFQKHLELPGSSKEQEVEYLTPEELQKTETGQLANSLRSKTVYDVNRSETGELLTRLQESRENLNSHIPAVVSAATELSGYREPEEVEESEVVFTGRFHREGYTVEKYFLPGEGEYVIPFLLMIPEEQRKNEAIVYIHPRSKAAEASPGGQLEWFAQQGYVVLAPDLVGTGEMGAGTFRGDAYIGGISYNQWFNSLLIGRSIVGVQAGDVVKLCRYLASHANLSFEQIYGVARESMAPVLLHAAAFDEIIAKVALLEPYLSYQSIVTNKFYNPDFIYSTVAGALTAYDLPDLTASLAPRSLLLVNMTDQNGRPVRNQSLVERTYAVAHRSYKMKNAGDSFHLTRIPPFESYESVLSAWLTQE
ncbi:MAG TPA: prolyl oligopeptidase family serine peptidase, partial [bacterium]|nr:prolyl oligopeptidase family serine peptidase [bacterium]